jgi:predicted NBD/HSP70 family sugar kinase
MLQRAAETDIERVFERAAAGDAVAQGVIDDAAYALGFVIVLLMNIVDPEKVIVTGEGLAVARAGQAAMDAAITERLDRDAERSEVEVVDFSFADYARAAAVSAIRRVI